MELAWRLLWVSRGSFGGSDGGACLVCVARRVPEPSAQPQHQHQQQQPQAPEPQPQPGPPPPMKAEEAPRPQPLPQTQLSFIIGPQGIIHAVDFLYVP